MDVFPIIIRNLDIFKAVYVRNESLKKFALENDLIQITSTNKKIRHFELQYKDVITPPRSLSQMLTFALEFPFLSVLMAITEILENEIMEVLSEFSTEVETFLAYIPRLKDRWLSPPIKKRKEQILGILDKLSWLQRKDFTVEEFVDFCNGHNIVFARWKSGLRTLFKNCKSKIPFFLVETMVHSRTSINLHYRTPSSKIMKLKEWLQFCKDEDLIMNDPVNDFMIFLCQKTTLEMLGQNLLYIRHCIEQPLTTEAKIAVETHFEQTLPGVCQYLSILEDNYAYYVQESYKCLLGLCTFIPGLEPMLSWSNEKLTKKLENDTYFIQEIQNITESEMERLIQPYLANNTEEMDFSVDYDSNQAFTTIEPFAIHINPVEGYYYNPST